MQSITKIHAWVWASTWLALAFWMTSMGLFVSIESHEKGTLLSRQVVGGADQDRIALTTIELV
jgi:hypothetical protein